MLCLVLVYSCSVWVCAVWFGFLDFGVLCWSCLIIVRDLVLLFFFMLVMLICSFDDLCWIWCSWFVYCVCRCFYLTCDLFDLAVGFGLFVLFVGLFDMLGMLIAFDSFLFRVFSVICGFCVWFELGLCYWLVCFPCGLVVWILWFSLVCVSFVWVLIGVFDLIVSLVWLVVWCF